MKVIKNIPIETPLENVFFTLGVFDGLHIGHQAVLRMLTRDAQQAGGTSVVMTFEPHPLRILEPRFAPPQLTCLEHKINLIKQFNVDYLFVIDFHQEFAQLSPGQFLNEYLFKNFSIAEICVGYDSAFGKNKLGTLSMLHVLGREKNFIVKNIAPIKIDDLIVSSTIIRQLVIAGELELVEVMLGRRYSIWGTVVKGATIGRKIGFPTANINPHHEAIPPSGVYVAQVKIDGVPYQSIMNIGYRPTFYSSMDIENTIEVHILDFNNDIYGAELEVIFLEKIREERRYPTQQKLIEQIRDDEEYARRYFARHDIIEKETN